MSTIDMDCGLARGNPQLPGILDWLSKSKIFRFNFLLDLKAQSKHREKNNPVRLRSLKNFWCKNMLEYELQNG